MPWTLGDSFIHVKDIDALVENEVPILELSYPAADELARGIGENIARLIDDGSTLQMGIGTIPDSILASLHDKRDLGVHTEMLSDGVIDLVEDGVLTNAKKTLHRGKMIGVGRYVKEKDSDMAELALLVKDDWQGKGLGSLMHDYLENIARARNIGGFKGEVLEQNKRALHLFTRLGRNAKTEYDQGVYTVSYRFDDQS